MSQEITVEELMYQLGNAADAVLFQTDLGLSVTGGTLPDGIQEKYEAFKRRASKLGVELPNFPEDEPSEKFFRDQIVKVMEYIKINKTDSMFQLFLVGGTVEKLLLSLHVAKRRLSPSGTNLTGGESDALRVIASIPNQRLQDLIQQARDLLGVDLGELGEELKKICENYENFRFDQDFDEHCIRTRLKRKLCGLREA